LGDTKNQDVLDAAGHTIVLAFDLAGSQIAAMPDELGTALQKPEVQSAIQLVLSNFVLAKQRSGTSDVSDKEAKQLATDLWNKAGGKITDSLLEQLKKSPEYKKLEKSLGDLEQALKSTPIGAWIDKNANILYVIGAGVAIGGAVALYATKTGGPAVNLPMSQLSGKSVKIFKVGGFTLSGQLLSFKPDVREVGGALTGTEKWDRVELSVQLGIIATGTEIKEVDGKIILKTQDINLGLTGKGTPATNTVNLGITFGLRDLGGQGPFTIGVSGIVQDSKLTGGQVTADWQLKGNSSVGLQGSATSNETRGFLLFTKRF
jgi:hypothetical protein